MIINIFTDASVNTDTHNAGYAFYIGAKGVKIQRAGTLRVKTNSSNVAELHCICNALHTLIKADIKGVTHVRVYSDSKACTDALGGLNRPPIELFKTVRELLFIMIDYVVKMGGNAKDVDKAFSFVHIPSHKKGKDKITLINRWCDREAGAHRLATDKARKYKTNTSILK